MENPKVKRPENWPDLLAQHIAEWSRRPFLWGSADCGYFAADWMAKLGYEDPLAGLAWTNARSVIGLFRATGGYEHIVQAKMVAMGCADVAVKLAKRGDLALMNLGNRHPVLGIVNGAGVLLKTKTGVAEFSLRGHAIRTWAV